MTTPLLPGGIAPACRRDVRRHRYRHQAALLLSVEVTNDTAPAPSWRGTSARSIVWARDALPARSARAREVRVDHASVAVLLATAGVVPALGVEQHGKVKPFFALGQVRPGPVDLRNHQRYKCSPAGRALVTPVKASARRPWRS